MTERRRDPEPATEARDAERDTSALGTFAPARNFTIPLAERIRAAGGPPAYSVRKRRIEDLEAELVALMRETIGEAIDLVAARRALETHRAVVRRLHQLDALVAAHNRYYPVEANLPLDPQSGALLERGGRWEPLPRPSFDALFFHAAHASR